MDNSLQEWADMYNKKDKEHFECQLKLAKLEQKLEKIKKIVEIACEDSVCHKDCENCSDGQILQIIKDEMNV